MKYAFFPGFVPAIWFLSGTLVMLHCASPNAPSFSDKAEVIASIQLPAAGIESMALTKFVLTITASDIDTIRTDLMLDGARASAQVKVPAGKSRLFSVAALQNTLPVLAGSQSLDLEAGKKTELKLKLNFLIAALTLSPAEISAANADTFSVMIKAFHVDSLISVGLKLKFDPVKLQVVELGRADTFLQSKGGSVTQLVFSRDNGTGEVDLVLGIMGSSHAVSGDGTVALIKFKTVAAGTVTDIALSLDNTLYPNAGLLNYKGNYLQSVALGTRVSLR